MKRSPAASSCSSSCSSSSCIGSEHSLNPKPKRPKKNHNNNNNNNKKCQNANSPSSGQRSSIYRGVTRHRWTGRFEAHLWDKSSWNNVQNKKGRQVYLGAYDNEEAAARTYDLAALKYWGPETTLNFPIETYSKEVEEMQKVSREEYLASLRRRSSGFSRGVSKYRGVARHHHNGRWEARIGRVLGNKYLYLGTYNTQEEAAAAYDLAAIEYRGANAVTNFDISTYIDQLKEKGIPFEHILQDPLPNSASDQSQVAEAEVEQPPPTQQQQQQQLPLQSSTYQQLPAPSMDAAAAAASAASAMIVMEDPIEEHELAWSFCMDPGLTPLPVPRLPLENDNACKLRDLFADTGFEDDIDFIFDSCCYNENEANLGCVSDDTGGCSGLEEVGVSGNPEEENGKERLLSSPTSNSPSCCSATSVSCNYFL